MHHESLKPVKAVYIASMLGLEQKVINIGQVWIGYAKDQNIWCFHKKGRVEGRERRTGWHNCATEQREEWYKVEGFEFP